MRKHLRNFFIPREENHHSPHFFRKNSIITVLCLVLILFILSSGLTLIVRKTNLLATVYPAVLVDLTNNSRHKDNLGTLRVSAQLQQVAQKKADDMATKEYFAHVSPEGKSPWFWFADVGYNFVYAGENLAVNFSESVDVENAWMNSPLHRANILSPHFTEIGIAVAQGVYKGRNTVFIAQEFGSPAAPTAPVESPIETTPSVIPAEQTNVLGESAVAPSKQQHKEVEEDTSMTAEVPTTTIESVPAQRLQIVEQENNYIAVQNILATPLVSNVEGASASTPIYYSHWYDRFLINPSLFIQYMYTAISILIIIALLFTIGIEFKKRHMQHIMYGLLLLTIVLVLMYLNSTLLVTNIIVM